MARSLEEVVQRIVQATEPDFRGRLVARGLARNLIWEDGALPEGSPPFALNLSSSLLGYGLALFQLGIELRRLDRGHVAALRAFERAGEAIESVVRDGDPEATDRGFYTIVAAAAYHLGHFSARAFSLLPAEGKQSPEDAADISISGSAISQLLFSPAQRAVALLIRRDLSGLSRTALAWSGEGRGFDHTLAEIIESGGDFEDAIHNTLNSLFHRALSIAIFGFELGQREHIEHAIELLREGRESSGELNSVPFWWIFSIAEQLVGDMWDQSLHIVLPSSDEPDWSRLRRLFIALLFRRKVAELELWPSQITGAKRAFDEGDDLVISLPTSAGKTRIAEIAILRALSLEKRVIFITPLRALSAQTEKTLRQTFEPLGFSVSSLYGSSGSNQGDRDSLRSRNIVVGTPEKLDFALRNDPELIDDVGLIVLDEAHSIGAGEREVRYEMLVQRLLRRGDASSRRLVCLSAILPENERLEDFVQWIRRDQEGDAVRSKWRPTRQRKGEILWVKNRGRLTFRVDGEEPWVDPFITEQEPKGRRQKGFPKDAKEFNLAIAWRLVEQEHTVLIYCAERRLVEPLARMVLVLKKQGYLTSLLSEKDAAAPALADAELIGREWLGSGHPAVDCLRMGVAVHHGTLPRPFQRSVERLLRDGILKVTIASPTLAQGLNLSATTVLFRSLTRNREPISGEEFANVAGRAGRAFVDVEGQVLCAAWTRRDLLAWEQVLEAAANRDLKSGLLTLVITFGLRLAAEKGISPAKVFDYLTANMEAWAPPEAPAEDADDEEESDVDEKQWASDLASIDSALLSLLQHDVPLADLAKSIDAGLRSSLWQKSLARESESLQILAKTILSARAHHIWTNSSYKQRRGYFYAGVGFAAGRYLDEHKADLQKHLYMAEGCFLLGETNRACDALIAFATIAFDISPFKPKTMLDGWGEILRAWVNGESMADLAGYKDNAVTEFIEKAFVYSLVWALESVRVQFSVEEGVENSEPSYSAMAVETGTPSIEAAMLIHNGLASRVAAMKALADSPATFSKPDQMRNWLSSDSIQALQQSQDWPTPETNSIWQQFVSSFYDPAMDEWSERPVKFKVRWDNIAPDESTAVRVAHFPEKAETAVFTSEMSRIGRLIEPFRREYFGVFELSADRGGKSISGRYLGPGMSDR
jgi:superfamily II DNA/RNA helicase